jgi:hypothetical protein
MSLPAKLNFVTIEVLKSRPGGPSACFLVCPALAHMALTPNGLILAVSHPSIFGQRTVPNTSRFSVGYSGSSNPASLVFFPSYLASYIFCQHPSYRLCIPRGRHLKSWYSNLSCDRLQLSLPV